MDKVYAYAIALGAIIFASFMGGYKTGEWRQGAADSAKVTQAQTDLAQNAKDVAQAEKDGRAAAAAIYEAEIKDLKDRAQFSDDLANQLRDDNTKLNAKLYAAQKAVEAAKHDPDAKAFLATPVPAALRNGVRDALATPTNGGSVPSVAGH